MESDMTGEQAAGFDRRLDTEPILRQQFSDFLKTRLVVPDQVVYPDKSELKRKIRLLTPWMITAISAAAVLVLALLLWPGPPTNTIPELAATGSGISIPATDVAKDNNPPAVQAPVEELPGQTRIAGLKTTVKSSGEPALANQQSPRDSVSPTALRPRVLQGPRIPEPNTTRTLYASNQIKPADISLPAEEVLTLTQYAFRLFREKILGQDPDLVRKTRFSLWEVAGAGVNGINSLAGTNMKLDRTYDPSADRMTLSFNSRLFDVETPVQGQVAR